MEEIPATGIDTAVLIFIGDAADGYIAVDKAHDAAAMGPPIYDHSVRLRQLAETLSRFSKHPDLYDRLPHLLPRVQRDVDEVRRLIGQLMPLLEEFRRD
jgi:hypothetical protein